MNAENLALGFDNADDVMRVWKESEGHNANLVWTKAKSLAVSAFIRYIGVDPETQSIPSYRYVQAQTFSCYANP